MTNDDVFWLVLVCGPLVLALLYAVMAEREQSWVRVIESWLMIATSGLMMFLWVLSSPVS